MLNRPGVLGTLIILTAFVVLMAVTIVRYWDRGGGNSGPETHPNGSTKRFEVPWSQLPDLQSFELVERAGEPVSEAQMEGRVSLVSFFFSRCPSICKQQNETLQRLQAKFREAGQDVLLVSVTVDPAYDTPEVLKVYAESYNADPENWLFLTGDFDEIKELGNASFQLPIGPETHSTSLMLVDRWGRVRDRFDWEQPSELKKLAEEVDVCLDEVVPPVDLIVDTRIPGVKSEKGESESVAGSADGDAWQQKKWIDEFTLVNSENQPLGSKDLKGKVWVANSFFTRCPTICKEMMAQVKSLQDSLANQPVVLVSLTSDPGYDTPARLNSYAETIGYDPDRWQFLTGDPLYVRRVMSEYLGMYVDTSGPTHDENLFLVDKWGRVRGKFAFNQPDDLVKLRMEIDRLVSETQRSDDPDLPVGNSSQDTNTNDDDVGESAPTDEEVEGQPVVDQAPQL
jgi:cytochrome oxidase Cu insertion factor (SCO1/SenC/PrrC family)